MRILLKFSSKNGDNLLLPFSYQYNIGAFIYAQMRTKNAALADELHQRMGGKGFTYSDAKPHQPYNIYANGIICKGFDVVISMTDEGVFNALMQSFKIGKTKLYFDPYREFTLTDCLLLADIDIEDDTLSFVSASPILVKLQVEGKKHPQFIDPEHPMFAPKVRELLEKRVGRKIENEECFNIEVYAFKKDGRDIVSKNNITTRNIAYKAELQMTAPLDFLREAYGGGIGVNNAMGFGMLDILKPKNKYTR